MIGDSTAKVLDECFNDVSFYYDNVVMACPLHLLSRRFNRRLNALSVEGQPKIKLFDLIMSDSRFYARRNERLAWHVAPASVLEEYKNDGQLFLKVMRSKI